MIFRSAFLGLVAAASVLCQTFTFSDGGAPLKVDLAPNEVFLTLRRGADREAMRAQVLKSLGLRARRVITAGAGGLLITFAEGLGGRFALPLVESATAAPVFYVSAEDPGGLHRDVARRVLTPRLLVRLDDEKWTALQDATSPIFRKASLLGEAWMQVEYGSPFKALDAAQWLSGRGWEFTPIFARQFQGKQAAAATGTLQRPVTDPLFPKQWHLANEGTGIRMKASWDLVTGKGINVTVVDDGLDVAHEDLSGNAYSLDSGFHRNFNEGDPQDPTPDSPTQTHGTNCGGLVAAQGFNNIGVIGVAPEARLMGLRLIAGPAADDAVGEALAWQPEGLTTHVSSNSWGPADDGKALGRMSSLQRAALSKATSTYRDSLGTVFCVSAGNGRAAGDNSSYDAFASSRFVIGVGAVNRQGEPSSFSEAGVNVAVTALGGEFDPPGVIWTTNNSGEDALAALRGKFESSQSPVNYSDAFNGTSAAAPQVSGAAALLLQHNPKLSYRDVKEVFMRSATRAGLKEGDAFKQNGGGLLFSHNFGAGLLNVSAALDLAAKWTPLGPLTSEAGDSGDTVLRIPDGDIEGAAFTFDFTGQRALRVETVELTVNVAHPNRGDIGFIIESPSGMLSIIENRKPDDGEDFDDFLFTSVRHWGESSKGIWTVRVVDIQKNGVTGRAGAITLRLHGTAQ